MKVIIDKFMIYSQFSICACPNAGNQLSVYILFDAYQFSIYRKQHNKKAASPPKESCAAFYHFLVSVTVHFCSNTN